MAMVLLEFYSGLGGLHYAAQSVLGSGGRVVEAFDINDTANDVYQHNFGRRPYQGNIEALTCRQIDRYAADMWLLSPPCQPYSRQGLQKQSRDARAASFITLLSKLPQLNKQPRHLLLENVVGFETSDTHADMLKTLHGAGYCTQGFILSPWQYGLPYSRPRYFCLAKKGHMALPATACQTAPAPGPGHAQAGLASMQDPGAGGAEPGVSHHEVLHDPPYVLLDRMRGGPGTLKEVPPLSHFLLQQPCPTADVPAPPLPVATPHASAQDPPQSPVDANGRAEQQGGGLNGAGAAHTGRQDSELVASDDTDDSSRSMRRREEIEQQCSEATGMDVSMADDSCHAAGSTSTACHNSHKRVLSDSAAGPGLPSDDKQSGSSKRSQQPSDSFSSQRPVATSRQKPTTSPTARLVPTSADQGELTTGCTEGQSSASCWGPFMVREKAMAQSGDVLDVVTGRSFRCKTFTKNYSQFMKGTGSIVCTAPEYQERGLCTREAVHERAVTQHGALGQPSPQAPLTEQHEPVHLEQEKEESMQPVPLVAQEESMQREARGLGEGAIHHSGQQRPHGHAAGSDASMQGAGEQRTALQADAPTGACGDVQPPAAGVADKAKGPGHPLMSRLDKQVMATEWKRMGLRFFTPREVASLHGLPPSFTFPSHLSLRARYQLLGNSLCVPVVADLIEYLLTESLTDPVS